MKRITLMIFLALCFNVINAFSQEAPREMSKVGIITAIDPQKTTLSIERREDKRSFTFVVDKEVLAKFKQGQLVEVTYTRNDKGERIASKVVITDKPVGQIAPAAPDTSKAQPADTAKPKEKEDDLDIAAPKNPTEKK